MQNTPTRKKRTILIIEDDFINREILSSILSDKYDVIQAENGKIGLEILEKGEKDISLILLDIQMPVMNGYEFLEEIKSIPSFTAIPIIVTTSSATANDEIKCLENGATDFVAKPYNPDVVLRRVSSMIRLREASSVIDKIEFDDITGFYSRGFFLVHSEKALLENAESDYDFFCCDIISFKVLQDRYGKPKGEKLLTGIAKTIKSVFGQNSICGKLNDDIFIVMSEHKDYAFYESAAETLRDFIKHSAIPNATVHLGLYGSVNHGTPVTVLCNQTHAAIEDVNYQYGKQIAEYNEHFRDKLVRRQQILGYMETAIKENQFEVYYQPKYSLADEKVGGAEALVRWTHPELGFISPGEFIPLFESCGFITELDFYLADKVCADLRKWLDEGKSIVPVSWNLSRMDFGYPNLAGKITEIVDKHSLPHELLHIEVTESAYTDNMNKFLSTSKELHDAGFCIELDDFGAGYSSLTVLSELDIDILKLDMYFAQNTEQEKQRLILKHIFSIADDLDIKVVAEGVETKEQSEIFKKLGCDYIQGYYYSKPLKKSEFEEYLNK